MIYRDLNRTSPLYISENMKKLLILAVVCGMLLSSCKKTDDGGETYEPPIDEQLRVE